jgi:hypothetical protein
MIARSGGNRALARAILQRKTYTWMRGRWVPSPGRSRVGAVLPPRDGEFEGQTYDDSSGAYSARPQRRRGRFPEAAPADLRERGGAEEGEPIAAEQMALEPAPAPIVPYAELVEWMASPARTTTQYGGTLPQLVRRLAKGSDVQLACWNWALTGFAPSLFHRDTVWQYLTQEETRLYGRPHPTPAWVTALPVALRAELAEVVQAIAHDRLLRRPVRRSAVPGWELRVQSTMLRTVTAIVLGNGFTLAAGPPGAWIVCHYKLHEGMAIPDHWWIELPGPHGRIVIQTVPGIDVEVGGEDLRWHSASSGRGRGDDAAQYREVRIAVAALLGPHITFLQRGLAEERARLERAAAGASRRVRAKLEH